MSDRRPQRHVVLAGDWITARQACRQWELEPLSTLILTGSTGVEVLRGLGWDDLVEVHLANGWRDVPDQVFMGLEVIFADVLCVWPELAAHIEQLHREVEADG